VIQGAVVRPSQPRVAVIGIGNPYRHDDGIGPAAVATIETLHLPGVSVTVMDGEATSLLDAFTGVDLAVLVDAVRCESATPGRIHRGRAVGRATGGNTHGLGVTDAIRLAEALDRIPRRLVLFGVEVQNTDAGLGLSEKVAAAIPELCRLILAELGG
jgi:hydrogenase maturation protease